MASLHNLERLLDEYGSKYKLAKATGISTGNISDWFNPRKEALPTTRALIKLADFFDCSIDYLLDRTDVLNNSPKSARIINLPILEQKASAGIGLEANEQSNDFRTYEFFEYSSIPVGTTHGIIISGDSMQPKFSNGQVVFIKSSLDCNDGDYGIFSVTTYYNTKVYCKQKKIRNDGSYYLHSINPNYPDPDIVAHEVVLCRCVGKILS